MYCDFKYKNLHVSFILFSTGLFFTRSLSIGSSSKFDLPRRDISQCLMNFNVSKLWDIAHHPQNCYFFSMIPPFSPEIPPHSINFFVINSLLAAGYFSLHFLISSLYITLRFYFIVPQTLVQFINIYKFLPKFSPIYLHFVESACSGEVCKESR